MPDTPARVLTFNGRRSDIPELKPSRYWSNRRKPTINYLKKIEPHVIGVQEFTKRMVNDIVYASDGLGDSWLHIGQEYNVRLLVDTRYFTPVNNTSHYLIMPSDLRKRYALFCQLQSRQTGETAWFASAHLAAGGITEHNPSALRHDQMRRIGEHITSSASRGRLILCADLNSKTSEDPASLKSGTRGIADNYGLLCLRRRLTADQIKGESLNSHHNWAATDDNYSWIDDILTTPAIELERATLYRTSADVAKAAYGGTPSDHNGIVMEAII